MDIKRNAVDDREPIVLFVNDPFAVAERCWDAGLTVRVGPDDPLAAKGELAVSVIDPFGRQIHLVR